MDQALTDLLLQFLKFVLISGDQLRQRIAIAQHRLPAGLRKAPRIVFRIHHPDAPPGVMLQPPRHTEHDHQGFDHLRGEHQRNLMHGIIAEALQRLADERRHRAGERAGHVCRLHRRKHHVVFRPQPHRALRFRLPESPQAVAQLNLLFDIHIMPQTWLL